MTKYKFKEDYYEYKGYFKEKDQLILKQSEEEVEEEEKVDDVESEEVEDVKDAEDTSEKDAEKEETYKINEKEYKDLMKQLQNKVFRNREMRIEFAKIVLQLASNTNKSAAKFVWKLSEFAKYWENDEAISEEEWRKLNNSEFEESTNIYVKSKK